MEGFYMVNIEAAKIDPSKIFTRPIDVIKDKSLLREEKIDILRRWAYDEREKAVAEEENMRANDTAQNNILHENLICLLQLKAEDDNDSPPTKQG
jgi:hypothetical protein